MLQGEKGGVDVGLRGGGDKRGRRMGVVVMGVGSAGGPSGWPQGEVSMVNMKEAKEDGVVSSEDL